MDKIKIIKDYSPEFNWIVLIKQTKKPMMNLTLTCFVLEKISLKKYLLDTVMAVRVHVWHRVWSCCAPWRWSKLETNHLVSMTQPWQPCVHPSVWAERGSWLTRPITAALRCRWTQWRQTGGQRAKRSVLSPGQTGSHTSHSSLFSALHVTGLCVVGVSSDHRHQHHHQHRQKKSIKSK